jgi:hypothetical protein
LKGFERGHRGKLYQKFSPNIAVLCGKLSSPLFLCRKEPQRKSYQKETAYAGLRAPNPRRLLKKAGENFSKKFCGLSVCAIPFF